MWTTAGIDDEFRSNIEKEYEVIYGCGYGHAVYSSLNSFAAQF
jgi:hypothetical protein